MPSVGVTASPAVGSQSALRRANADRVLQALRTGGPSSQAAVARATSLSRQTVGNAVRSLVDEGRVVVEAGANGRETLVRLRPVTGAVIGVDIGYREAHAVLVHLPEGTRVDSSRMVLSGGREAADDDALLIVQLIDDLLAESGFSPDEVLGVGVSLPQPIDAANKLISATPVYPGWAGVPIMGLLARRFGTSVVVENDANAAALAELTWGAGRGRADFVHVMAAYGIGAGIVSRGELFRGGTGMAGEIGHITIDDRGPVCVCGKRGDLGALASGRALVNQLRSIGDHDTSMEQLVAHAREGEVRATRMIAESGRWIGMAVAHLAGILAPELVVVGGPLAEAGDVLLDPVRAALRDMVITPRAGGPQLARSRLGPDAPVLGAVALVLQDQGLEIEHRPTWIPAAS